MMVVGFIDIDIVGGRRSVQNMLEHLDSALSPIGMSIFLSGRVSPWLRERARDRFRSEGDDAVGRWQQLSEATERIRLAAGFMPAHPINRRTGQLEEYITGTPGDVQLAPGWASLTFPEKSSNPVINKKVRTAQRGAANPITPSRPVLGLSEIDLAHVLTHLALHVQGWNRNIAP